MRACPNCNAPLDDHARFCLCCMTSLEEKEQIQPPKRRVRRWPSVLLCVLIVGLLTIPLWITKKTPTPNSSVPTVTEEPPETTVAATTPPEAGTIQQTINGVTYTFRPATAQEHPTAIRLEQHYTLIRVEGVPETGIYQIPSFVNDNTNALVSVIAEDAFSNTPATAIDLGHNVRYVWGNAFGGNALTDLFINVDVWIDEAAFSGCRDELTIHSLLFVENTQGILWSELATDYGFHWQERIY